MLATALVCLSSARWVPLWIDPLGPYVKISDAGCGGLTLAILDER
jgi:hypothetical protein